MKTKGKQSKSNKCRRDEANQRDRERERESAVTNEERQENAGKQFKLKEESEDKAAKQKSYRFRVETRCSEGFAKCLFGLGCNSQADPGVYLSNAAVFTLTLLITETYYDEMQFDRICSTEKSAV